MAEQSLMQTVSAALATMSLDLDLKGGADWAPSRSPKKDYSKWGVWEAWPYCRIGNINPCMVGPIPTGDWIAWNSETGQIMSCGGGPKAMWKAEVLAVSQNQGKPTRVVALSGESWESEIRLKDVERMLKPAVKAYEEQMREEAGAEAPPPLP